ncbi:MAG TPA: DNA polymerase/3'-5' exonuclease PolX [Bacillales bacterium]|nr:DNA polymerase/3'-5' exonuclease PolX [Bacillales bacterium]
MNKKDIVKALETIAVYLEIQGENSFKVSAYRRAAQALESDERSLAAIGDVSRLKGIGSGTAAVIDELKETGRSSLLEQLTEAIPNGLLPLLHLPGLGGKKIARLYGELGVTDLTSLEKVCREGQVRGLSGFGKKSEEKLLAAIEEVGKRPDRLPVAYMLRAAEEIERQLREIPSVQRFSRAGSLRRLSETVKDLDFVVATEDPQACRAAILALAGISEIVNQGNTKLTVAFAFDYEVQADFRLVEPDAYATALHHFTGSKEHNVKMRQLAKARGEKISEYGIETIETGEVSTFTDEAAFFAHFGLKEIPPELRVGGEEINKFETDVRLISESDVRADLHMHTTWSDGAYTIEEMAEAARQLGYEYIAITDHSKSLVVAKGLDEEKLARQREEICRLNEKYDDFTLFSGTEMDILPNGRLDFEDEVLAKLDFVIASIHSSFSQSRKQIMERLKTAIYNPHVDLVAHPTGRLIGRRKGYDVDVAQLIEWARETDTALELNANPNRFDLAANWLRLAQEAGVRLSVNTDAHYKENLTYMKVGISFAKKGWIRPETVINTYTKQQFLAFLNRNRGEPRSS